LHLARSHSYWKTDEKTRIALRYGTAADVAAGTVDDDDSITGK